MYKYKLIILIISTHYIKKKNTNPFEKKKIYLTLSDYKPKFNS